jgi:hypothetical protein
MGVVRFPVSGGSEPVSNHRAPKPTACRVSEPMVA